MAAPSVSSTTHAHGSEDKYINVGIEIVFAEDLDSTTVDENTFGLTDLDTLENVAVSVSLTTAGANASKEVIVQPKYHLKENTSYRLIIIGTADKIVKELASDDGSKLATSLVYEFTTGDSVYSVDKKVEKQADNLTLEGDLFLPTNVKALGTEFTLKSVRPKNHTWDNRSWLTGDRTVKFLFSKTLSGIDATGLHEWADVEVYPMVDTSYLSMSGTLKTETGSTAYNYDMPTGSFSVAGETLTITLSKDTPENSILAIDLKKEILATDGSEYGGALEYAIALGPYPATLHVRSIKTELRPLDPEDIYDDYLASLLHKNTIFMWEKLARGFSLTDMPWAAKKLIWVSTVLDIIEDKDYAKFLASGTIKQLGDLNTSVYNLTGRLAMKAARLLKDQKLALESLRKGWQFQWAVKQESQEGVTDRLWYDVNGRYTSAGSKFRQTHEPIANTPPNRHAITNNPGWAL